MWTDADPMWTDPDPMWTDPGPMWNDPGPMCAVPKVNRRARWLTTESHRRHPTCVHPRVRMCLRVRMREHLRPCMHLCTCVHARECSCGCKRADTCVQSRRMGSAHIHVELWPMQLGLVRRVAHASCMHLRQCGSVLRWAHVCRGWLGRGVCEAWRAQRSNGSVSPFVSSQIGYDML